MTTRDQATERQVQAARPDASTWLAANAGSGKTRVLTDRVARLLLEGVEPQNILCLTYTKAAASEMQNRLFDRLGEWAMLDDRRLENELTELGADGAIAPDRMRHARTLFARAIETPGGLKIQTIHSFCASLLRRFPLEAGVSPQFAEIEDRAARLLWMQIVEDFAAGEHAGLVDGIARHITDFALQDLIPAIVQKRHAFSTKTTFADILAVFDLPPGFDRTALISGVFLGDERQLITGLIAALQTGGVNDRKAAAVLSSIAEFDADALPVLESVFLTGAKAKEPFSAKLGSFPTKAVRQAFPDLVARIDPLMQRIESARNQRLGLMAAEKAYALNAFAAVFLAEYERRKQIRGLLDFDDQIWKARELLNDPAVAAWVLYRLDGGIDHILVDEAQDTSPDQWDVIEKLAQEFTSGQGARPDTRRTIFVVGDKKQSIYSFQGADPNAFDKMQADFSARLSATGTELFGLTLEFSFRSAETILRLVDLVFENRDSAGFVSDSKHRAFKSMLPARVDLWPPVPKVDDDEAAGLHWTDPVDRPSPVHHYVILAERIATSIKSMIETGQTIPEETKGEIVRRPVRAGDFLVLVQRRSDLFGEIIRACKAAGLPIAGADRLKVGAELAVKDLGALLKFLATPEDDLSLATALRSPLCGWSEQALFDVAHRRGETYLWQALREQAARFPTTVSMLSDLLGQTDFLRPYDLIERILTRHDGRARLLSRLGAEAEDGINALLSQALAYERSEIPSLTGFLTWLETDGLEIKRQMGSVGDMIRVMTVHGAKGLESPIVILPDTARRQVRNRDEVMLIQGVPAWRTNADETPSSMDQVRQTARQNEMNERLRLLYVALTRAEKHLIIATAGDLDKNGDSWYQIVAQAMEQAGAVPHEYPGGQGLRLMDETWDSGTLEPLTPEHAPDEQLPDYFGHAAILPPPAAEILSPSDLGGAKAIGGAEGETEDIAKQRGARIHLLLERLGDVHRADRETACAQILNDASADERADALAEAGRVLDTPDLGFLFSSDALAEVPVTAEIGGTRIHGVIDRLIVDEKIVTVVDFKSNATIPDDPAQCPEGILRQMGAYSAVLSQIYPDHEIRTAILWTHATTLMQLPHDLVMEALGRTPHLDAIHKAT